MHSLRRCDCGVFGDLGVAGFASRGIVVFLVTLVMLDLQRDSTYHMNALTEEM